MAAERKLDIFQLLKAVDKHDGNWFSNQSEEAQKEFAPPVAMRWAATVEGKNEAVYMLWMINERVNLHLYELYKHPELVYRLMASCGIGQQLRHQWIPSHKRKGGSNKAFDFLTSLYPSCNDNEIDILLSKYTKETFSQLLEECGIQSSESKELVKAFTKTKDTEG